MNIQTVNSLLAIKNISQAELARRVKVSRQVFSQWKKRADLQKNPNVNIYSETQNQIAKALGVSLRELNRGLEVNKNKGLKKIYETELLWDRLYPDIESFAAGVVMRRSEALARLVQVYGIYASAKMVGKDIWKKFDQYKSKLPRPQREQAETLWNFEMKASRNDD